MAIQGVKTIAEYAIRKWLIKEGFVLECFELDMHGNQGILTDQAGATMTLEYVPESKSVIVKEEPEA
ncbi:MAG: hypothetical protein K2H45_04305 [Acetatifactor sp.]|nr:hypothetical protein [Acetatifactor sp.]